jgi:DNA adenine methylase
LKWAGGKRQLLDALSGHYPAVFDRYVEPFLGSGAVFFDLHARGLLDGRRAWLADVNPDLVGCYRTVRDNADMVIAALRRLQSAHRAGGERFYYEVRDRRFNPVRAAMRRDVATVAADRYTPALAAMLIFLNRTGFNGLFRLNREGAFNVPAGRYADPRICDPDHVRSAAIQISPRVFNIHSSAELQAARVSGECFQGRRFIAWAEHNHVSAAQAVPFVEFGVPGGRTVGHKVCAQTKRIRA